jgi:hypothetical protein
MSDWYILHDDHSVSKAVTEAEKFLAYKILGCNEKIVAQEHVGNKWVSTVFLGLDHSYCSTAVSSPMIFETMVFEDDHCEGCFRYSTWDEAVDGHRKVCSELQSGLSRDELEAAKAVIEPLLSNLCK